MCMNCIEYDLEKFLSIRSITFKFYSSLAEVSVHGDDTSLT